MLYFLIIVFLRYLYRIKIKYAEWLACMVGT